MGLSRSALANWRHRNSIPLEHVDVFAAQRGVSLDYLIRGSGLAWYSGASSLLGEVDPERWASASVDGTILQLCLEEAAQKWAAEHPDKEMTMSALAHHAAELYEHYRVIIGSDPKRRSAKLKALSTTLLPHIHWRISKRSAERKEAAAAESE